ncbi:MAG: FecR domain-containing protein [Archangium sp.]|nr:FecR domain-containing protein [Archangium sp.]
MSNHLEHDTLWALSRAELNDAEAKHAEGHLAQCPDCRVSFEDVKLAQQVLMGLPEVPPMPEQMARRVGANLAEAADALAAKSFTSWWQALFTPRFVLAAALGLVLVAAGAWLLAEATPPPSPVALTPSPVERPPPLPTPVPLPVDSARGERPRLSVTVASAKKSSASKAQVLNEGATVATQSGGSVWMKLPDGSRAGLTATSEVKLVTLEEKQLTLDLAKGSLAMVVPHRTDRVLTVRAGDLEVIDLGTRFLVSRDQTRTLVAVEEGKVEVKTPTGRREVTAGHAVTWSGGQLTELPWETTSAPTAPPPVANAPEAVQPDSIARLGDEDEDDSPPPPEEAAVQEPEQEQQPDRTPTAADEADWNTLPENQHQPQPLKYPPVPLPPKRAVTSTERGFSLRGIERKLRELGTSISSTSAREAGVRNIAFAADANDCHHALKLADRWLSDPVTNAPNEAQMRRGVQLQQVRCLNHLGRTQDADTILKMIGGTP